MSDNTLSSRLTLAASLFGSIIISGTGVYYGASAAIDAIPDDAKTSAKALLCDAFSIPCQLPEPAPETTPETTETTAALDTSTNIPRSYIIKGKRDEVRTRGPIVIDCDISLDHSEAVQRRDLSKCESIQGSQEFLKRRSMVDLHVTFS